MGSDGATVDQLVCLYSDLPEHALVNLVMVFSMLIHATKDVRKQRLNELLKALGIPCLSQLGKEIRQSATKMSSCHVKSKVEECLGSFVSAVSFALGREAVHRGQPRWIRIHWRETSNQYN